VINAHETDPGNPQYHYDMAMIYALTGRKDDALESPENAARNGYSDRDKLAQDATFDSIRQDPCFEAILRRLH
jgi:hypothetical protein